jgi:aspartyl protease family protein
MYGRARAAALAGVLAWSCVPAIGAAVQRIEVQALFKDQAVLTIDGKRRSVRAGQTTAEGVRLISANSREAVVEIDGKQRTLALGTRISGAFPAPREQQVLVPADVNGMYLVNGAINGVGMQFMLDTGATLVSINESTAARVGLDYRGLGTPGRSITAAGVVRIWRLRLARVRIGEVELHDVDAAVHEGEFPPVALLGNSFLSRVEMTRAAGAVLLRRQF